MQPRKVVRVEPVGTCYMAKNNFHEFTEYSPCRTSKYPFLFFAPLFPPIDSRCAEANDAFCMMMFTGDVPVLLLDAFNFNLWVYLHEPYTQTHEKTKNWASTTSMSCFFHSNWRYCHPCTSLYTCAFDPHRFVVFPRRVFPMNEPELRIGRASLFPFALDSMCIVRMLFLTEMYGNIRQPLQRNEYRKALNRLAGSWLKMYAWRSRGDSTE